ncbi:hypothetical protein GUITHDRAFT_141945 [Guillardia theta CCMP2712]|uniref:TIR domain-containing protein n=1 Tax=Guillardia theta (strain CCMP2712) TaxID=905079 RepID=L1IZW7_GUITC|nr:hypothetical protein GUITHDRAFT_141945 [Guillardia theta CCMP2712]EKX41459.1 hypothetical protein GUITHDRAFT_141945 [Guillardia theta CCMP2712]|eukprot:XP_005828439.1 hypothetical protein GUITHDRAFT_141945 [Guillardia theta CCMP2712]
MQRQSMKNPADESQSRSRFTVLDAEAPEFTPSGCMAPEPFAVDGTADITIDGLQIDEEVEEVEEVRQQTQDLREDLRFVRMEDHPPRIALTVRASLSRRRSNRMAGLTNSFDSMLPDGRYEASRALGNIAFQNPGCLGQALPPSVMEASGAADALMTDNCWTIVTTDGMLEGLTDVLRNGNVNSKHEAARVINNCAAYSSNAAEYISSRMETIEALKNLCGSGGRAQRTKAKAIGAIHCLSTYPQARKTLIAVRVVEEALIPTLLQKKRLFGDGDEYKAMRADTVLALYDHQLMAVANLSGSLEDSFLAADADCLKTIIKCLRHGLDGKIWAGVAWTAYTALLPLTNLTKCDKNKDLLAELGLIDLLCRCLNVGLSKVEESLAMSCFEHLVFSAECRSHVDDRWGFSRKAKRMIWILTKQSENAKIVNMARQHNDPEKGKHVYLSYFPENQPEKVRALKEKLDGHGFVLWSKSSSSENETAEAIASSSLVICCITREYKECPTCRFEGALAFELGKEILCIVLENGFNEVSWGWLSEVIRDKTSLDWGGDESTGLTRAINIVLQTHGKFYGVALPSPVQSPNMKPRARGSPKGNSSEAANPRRRIQNY